MSSSSSSNPVGRREATAGPPTGPPPRPRTAPGLSPIQRAQYFEGFTAWPVFLSSIVFFGATFTLLAGSIHDAHLIRLTQIVAVVAYALVLLDFLVRTALARKELREFLRRNWFELVGLLLPFLRPFVIIIYLWRLPSFRRSNTTVRARLLVTTFLFMFMYVYLLSSTVWLVERNAPGASIVNLDDAIWWGYATLTTVGYGDFVPITTAGRVLAVGLMLGGIAIVGTTTALVVSVLGEQLNQRRESLVGSGGNVAGHGHGTGEGVDGGAGPDAAGDDANPATHDPRPA